MPEILLKKKIKKDFREKPLIKADYLKNLLVAKQKIKIENREKSKTVKRLSIDNDNIKADVLKKLCFLLSTEGSVKFHNKDFIQGSPSKTTILQNGNMRLKVIRCVSSQLNQELWNSSFRLSMGG